MLAEATPKETVCKNTMSTTIDTQKTRLDQLVLKTTSLTEDRITDRKEAQ
jgi:hypothetical protein